LQEAGNGTTDNAGGPKGAEKRKDICSIAIDHLKGSDGSPTQDDREVDMHQLKTFYFAGHDTTATLIAWIIWLLSQHDDVREKLLTEIQNPKIWANSSTPTYDQLQQCSYLDAVLKEALRLYPPAGSARYT
jgi:cytochrome P450